MENLINNFELDGFLEIPDRNKGTIEDLRKEDQSDVLVVVTSHGEKLFRMLERIANEEMYEDKGLLFGHSHQLRQRITCRDRRYSTLQHNL